jgi:hypothetical protein
MRLPPILLCALLLPVVAAPPIQAAPVARRATTPKPKFGKVTFDHGRAVLTPTQVPDDEDDGVRVEIAGDGMPELADPDHRGVFAGKLKRGRKAKLSAGDPADKGVALLAMQGATSVPLYMGLYEPGIHLRGEQPAHGVSTAANGLAAIVFAAAPMQGDDIAIECSGAFPSEVRVRVVHLSATTLDGVDHEIDGSSGQLGFVVPLAGMNDGIIVATIKPKNGDARVEKCVVNREAAQ